MAKHKKAAYVFVVEGKEHGNCEIQVLANDLEEAKKLANDLLPIPMADFKIARIVSWEVLMQYQVKFEGGKNV